MSECSLLGWLTWIVLTVTGGVIAWYTVEIQRMRKEMTRQNALHVQPFVFVTEIVSQPDALVLRNMGMGAALHIQIDAIEFDVDGASTPDYVAKFSTVDVIEQETKCVRLLS